MEKLLYGVAYYDEYMPYDRLEKDVEMMKKAGINTVRIAESTWSTCEPQEGVFDFSHVERVMDAMEKAEISVIIGTPTYAIPTWMVKSYPDVLATTVNGKGIYGARQIMDITHPVYRYYAERVIRELMKHTAHRKCVIGFQIDNETKHYGNMGREIQAAFRKAMEEKFQTTENLNKAFGLAYWSNSIHNWEDFPDMRGCINGGLASEFSAFQRKMAADYLMWQADLIREYKREDQFITHNLDFEWKKFGADIAQDGYSYGVQPDINHYEAAKALTLAGTDIYHPTQDDLTGAETAFGGDSVRSLKDSGYLVLECQAQAFKYWTPYPGQLRLQAYSHLASGAIGTLYWNWHSIHSGYETYWRGVLSHDLDTNPVYEEAAVIGKEWSKLGEKINGLQKKNEIALVIDNHSMSALNWFPIDKDLSYNDVVRWMYDSLYEMNLECDVVDVRALDPSRYRMIVTPALYSVPEEMLKKLETFVRKGGVLVSSFRSFVADEYLRVYHDKAPHILHECFGMSYNQFTEPGRTRLKGKEVRYFAELLKMEGAESMADYEHKYWGRYAGMTHHTFGEGHAYYMGCWTCKETLKELYRKAAKSAGIFCPELAWPVTVRSGVNREGKQIHYLLHYSEEEQEILCPYDKAVDLLTGKSYRKGEPICLSDWDVKILEEA